LLHRHLVDTGDRQGQEERDTVGKIAQRLQKRFALAFACFRNACIRQGVYKRAQEGNASSVSAAEHGIRAGFVADLGWRLASGDDAAVLEAD